MANKAPGTEGQQQVNGEKKETPAVPSAPPSYEEATKDAPGEQALDAGIQCGVGSPGLDKQI